MIRVEVEGYCSECLDFQPDVEKPQKLYANVTEITMTDTEIIVTDTVIRCKNRKRCEHIRRYLERKCTDDDVGEIGEEMP